MLDISEVQLFLLSGVEWSMQYVYADIVKKKRAIREIVIG